MRVLLFLLLAPAAIKLHTGFRFTEGPAADASGAVFFNDVPNEKLYKVDVDGKLTLWREKTNRANGLFFHGNGDLYACEGGAGAVVAYSKDGSRRVIADKYEGKRFNAPNDLVIDRAGGVYFTDPKFGRDKALPQGVWAVYHIAPDLTVTRLIDDLPRPNGIILSPDEKTLYVVCSGQADVMAYPIESPGKLGKGRVFFTIRQPKGKKNTGGDGLTVDANGTLYITSWRGVQVVSSKGALLDILEFPEKPANCTFGGRARRNLYITARTSLYTVRLQAPGYVFPAGRG
ncbi:MAG: SMP-30/gluconolactonase/LRE family protein [Planctomycetota bacterium]|jgi:gluconolactonase